MSEEVAIEVTATLLETPANAMFQARGGREQTLSFGPYLGQNAEEFIRILPGDKVLVELSPYDLKRGRITCRYK